MRAMRLGQRLAVAVALSLTLLVVGAVGLGVGITHGDVALPDLDVHVSGLHIVGYTTDPMQCRLAAPCPGPRREYQVGWAFRGETAPNYGRETWHRLFNVPLQR